MLHRSHLLFFLADLKVFSYILCLIILICVELKFITHARIELNIHACTSYLYFTLLFVVTGWGRLENHTIFTRIITYKSISKNTWLQFATIYVFQTIFHQICWAWAIFRRKLKSGSRKDRMTDELIWGGLGNLRFLQVNISIWRLYPRPSDPMIVGKLRLSAFSMCY